MIYNYGINNVKHYIIASQNGFWNEEKKLWTSNVFEASRFSSKGNAGAISNELKTATCILEKEN